MFGPTGLKSQVRSYRGWFENTGVGITGGRGASLWSDLDADTLFLNPKGFSSTSPYATGTYSILLKDATTNLFSVDTTGLGSFAGGISTDKKLIVTDSLRVEKTSILKGTVTFGATATSGTLATTGKITSPDSVVAVKGFRTEGTSLFKNTLTAGSIKFTSADASVALIDTVKTAGGVVRWVKFTVGGVDFLAFPAADSSAFRNQ